MYIKTISLLFLSGSAFCQQNIVTTGGDASDASGSMSYSIGLISYHHTDTVNGTIYEGNQQPYELFSVGLEEWNFNVDISAYPNPMTSQLIIAFPDNVLEDMRYTLTNELGQVIQNGPLVTKETTVDVMPLAIASYFLTLYKNDQSVRVYKLVKH